MGADFAEPHGSGERFVGNGGISRYLWEQQMGNGSRMVMLHKDSCLLGLTPFIVVRRFVNAHNANVSFSYHESPS